jgi:hypothetical protein
MNMSGMELARLNRKVELAEREKEIDIFREDDVDEAEDEDDAPLQIKPAPRNEKMVRYHYMSRLGFNPHH